MHSDEIRTYLADALDQEACKETLLVALQSRVKQLQAMDISSKTLIDCLEDLCDDPYQINDDIVLYVMETLIIRNNS